MDTRKRAMKDIRSAEWYGETPPTIKLNPHGPGLPAVHLKRG
jgi:hypothetical protein